MVNWQKTDYYRDMKAWERETGLTIADVNRMNNPGGSHTVGGMLAMAAPSIFMSIVCKAADGSFGGGSSAGASSTEAATIAKQIRSDIDAILTKYENEGITNIDDLETFLQSKCDEKDTNVKTLKSNITSNNRQKEALGQKNKEIDGQIASNNKQIGSLRELISNLRYTASLKGSPDIYNQEIQEYEKQINALEESNRVLEEEKAKNDKEIQDLATSISIDKTTLDELQAIQKDIDDLKTLSKQLRKAEGKDAIESLTNDQTADIAGLIKKLNNAEMNNDKEKAEKIKKELKAVLEEYVKNPDNKNKTILNYAKKLGIN